ncbi:transmembrane 56-B-like [Olea europaea subsp. europaea]|uniref:Transmembrane 56-B-like n=1 Tax=Olea europaea subsp. europaea TaxID=158383 RepID=A0A8S0UX05_OLEEU|nr:transmembrane 56-B-like [Olea europaea subsp. europaea]
MWDLEITLGSINIDGHATPSRILNWLSSIFAGILMCKIIDSSVSCTISTSFFKGYSKLNRNERLDWKNRGFSTFHAILVAAGSLYLLLGSRVFDGAHDFNINMTSTLSDTIMGVSIGYFISDSAILLYHFPVLGGLEFVLHHGLSLYSIILSLLSGRAQIYILMVLFSECTTPFVNLRWYLDVAGQKNSKLYIFNGVALFFGWLVARVLLFVFLFYHMFIHFDQVKKVFPLGFYSLLTVAPLLALMNVFWFWKIANGLVKTLNKAKHSQ